MATANKHLKKKKTAGGPYLAVAVFCESILEEKPVNETDSGALSAMRIYDQIAVKFPTEIPAGISPVIAVKGLITFRAGDSLGPHILRIFSEYPDGTREDASKDIIVKFKKKGQSAANVKLTVAIKIQKTGLYWFDVTLDGKSITRMPLRIVIEKAPEIESE